MGSSAGGSTFRATPTGDDFQVNFSTPGAQVSPAVALDGSGDFVVVWEGPDGNATGIWGRRYTSSGAPVGGDFQINTFTPGAQKYPSVASSVSGDLVVVWQSKGSDGNMGRYCRPTVQFFGKSGERRVPGQLVYTQQPISSVGGV